MLGQPLVAANWTMSTTQALTFDWQACMSSLVWKTLGEMVEWGTDHFALRGKGCQENKTH